MKKLKELCCVIAAGEKECDRSDCALVFFATLIIFAIGTSILIK